MTDQFETRDFFKSPLNAPVDTRWRIILDKVRELEKKPGYRPSSRGAGMYSKDGNKLSCVAKFYHDNRMADLDVYIISYSINTLTNIDTITVEGPFVDSNDQYWLEMKDRDDTKGNFIVTDDYVHYTVLQDRPRDERDMAGHGGAEFRFVLEDSCVMSVGTIERSIGTKRILITHNLWQQGPIPVKHQHLFPPNAKLV